MKPLRFLASALGASLATTSVAYANPVDTFGFGSRCTSMGNACVADARDLSAAYYNPSLLSERKRFEAMLGYSYASHHLSLSGRNSDIEPVRGFHAGLATAGTFGKVPFAFGVALHLPDERISRVRALRQEEPRWELFDSRNQRIYFAANVAIAPLPWLEFGAGLAFMSSTRGRVDITGNANIFNTSSSTLRHEVDADLTAVRYPQFGMLVRPTKKVALGLAYRGAFQLELDLKARLQGDLGKLTTAYYALESFSVSAFLPAQIALCGSWAIAPRVRANVDLTYIFWSSYVSPVPKLTVELDIPTPKEGWPVGIEPPTTPTPVAIVPIRMRDRIVPHLGVEFDAVSTPTFVLQLRAGYEYALTPIPPQRGITNFVDTTRHTFSLGVGANAKDWIPELPDVKVDLVGTYSAMVTTTIQKDSPADLVGNYVAAGHLWNMGVTTSFGF